MCLPFAGEKKNQFSLFSLIFLHFSVFPIALCVYVCTGVGFSSVSKIALGIFSPVLWIHANFTFAMLLSCECVRESHLVPKKSYDFGISFFSQSRPTTFHFSFVFGYVLRRSRSSLHSSPGTFVAEKRFFHWTCPHTKSNLLSHRLDYAKESTSAISRNYRLRKSMKFCLQIAPSISLWAARHCNFRFNWITNRSP